MVVVLAVLPSGFGVDHDAMETVCLIVSVYTQLIDYIYVDMKLNKVITVSNLKL